MSSAINLQMEDENSVAVKLAKATKLGVLGETKRRAALGDLQNRAFGVASKNNEKDAAKKELKDVKLFGFGSIRTTKARVDSNLKKPTTATTNALSSAVATEGKPEAVTATQVHLNRRVRPASIRLSSQLAGNKLQRAVSTTAINGVTTRQTRSVHPAPAAVAVSKTKTLTTKLVENNVQHVKLITKTSKDKVVRDDKVISTTSTTTTLRREDSNLSRKCIMQLKAAINANAKPTTTIKTAETAKEKTKISTSAKPVVELMPQIQPLKSENVENVLKKVVSATILPGPDVEDIDIGDSNNLILVSEYVNDIYKYLFELECEMPIRKKHLEGQVDVTPKMRGVLVDWMNEVHVQFSLAAETFQIAVAIIDRYLQIIKTTQRFLLQLVGVTALFIAAKYEELYPPPIADFVYITDNTYNVRQILQMELQIFKTLDCNLSRPLPIQFLRRFSKAADVEDIHHYMAKYFIELCLVEYDMASYKPSQVAAASLFLTLHLLRDNHKLATGFNDKHWNATMIWYSGYQSSELRPIARRIATIARDAPNAKLKAVYLKYEKTKQEKISLRPELYGALMDSIISTKD